MYVLYFLFWRIIAEIEKKRKEKKVEKRKIRIFQNLLSFSWK